MNGHRAGLASALLAGAAILMLQSSASFAEGWEVEAIVPPSGHGAFNGIGFDPSGRLLAASVPGQTIYEIDTATGAVKPFIGPPEGDSDDIAFAPDGTMVWTSFLHGRVMSRSPSGETRVLAEGLPGVNSIAFAPDGRLFATQVFLGDALYEIDRTGAAPPRKIMEGMGGLNGFNFGADGMLYGPIWFKGQVVKLDVDSGEMTVLAEGIGIPAAVEIDREGKLYTIDSLDGEVIAIDQSSGTTKVVATLPTGLDNLAFDADNQLYVSSFVDGIYKVDVATGKVDNVVFARVIGPAGIHLVEEDGKSTLYLADNWALREIDAATGKVRDIARNFASAAAVIYPEAVTVGESRIYASSWFSNVIQIYDRSSGALTAVWQGFALPQDMVELEGQGLLVAELAAGKLTLAAGDDGATRTDVLTGLAGPVGLKQARDGALYLTELGGTVSRIDPATWTKTVVAEGLNLPLGVAEAPDGSLVVAEVGLGRIISVDPKTGAVTALAEDLPGVGGAVPAGMPFWGRTDVAVGSDGTIYYTGAYDSGIYRLVRE